MSEWYEPKDGDIRVDPVTQDVDIYVKSDDWGSVYVTLTFTQLASTFYKAISFKQEQEPDE